MFSSTSTRSGAPAGRVHRDSAARLADLSRWITPLYPIRDGTSIVLKLLREGGKPTRHVAHQGSFSQMLGGKVAQMVRIRLPRALKLLRMSDFVLNRNGVTI